VRITALTLFPIKSCAGVSVPSATVSSRGFAHDRLFLVVDFTGRFLTQRKLPRMALITPSIRVEAPSPAAAGGDVLVLAGPGVEPLDVPVIPEAGGGKGRPPPAQVVVWGDTVDAVDQGDAAAAWLAKFLEQPGVRLVVRWGRGWGAGWESGGRGAPLMTGPVTRAALVVGVGW